MYARRRPFHPQRLVESAIQQLPAKTNLALKEQLQAPPDPASPFAALVRSKGFLWLSNNHLETFYWAHAGSHFEVKKQGLWWATIDQKDWPPEDAADIAAEMAPTYGDRRQELVFIGIGLDEAALTAKLDSCLLTDAEMLTYKCAPPAPLGAWLGRARTVRPACSMPRAAGPAPDLRASRRPTCAQDALGHAVPERRHQHDVTPGADAAFGIGPGASHDGRTATLRPGRKPQ